MVIIIIIIFASMMANTQSYGSVLARVKTAQSVSGDDGNSGNCSIAGVFRSVALSFSRRIPTLPGHYQAKANDNNEANNNDDDDSYVELLFAAVPAATAAITVTVSCYCQEEGWLLQLIGSTARMRTIRVTMLLVSCRFCVIREVLYV